MNGETIAAIITAGLAFVTSVISIFYNFIQGKRESVRKIILQNRVKYMEEIREGFTNVVGLSFDKAIKLAKGDPRFMTTFSEKLFYGYGKIKTFIKPFYPVDKELLTSLDLLYNCILSALCGDEDAFLSLDKLREDFADKYLKYDWAYWKYIQKQRDGKYFDSDKAFDRVY